MFTLEAEVEPILVHRLTILISLQLDWVSPGECTSGTQDFLLETCPNFILNGSLHDNSQTCLKGHLYITIHCQYSQTCLGTSI
jgi:hypothetical protein